MNNDRIKHACERMENATELKNEADLTHATELKTATELNIASRDFLVIMGGAPLVE